MDKNGDPKRAVLRLLLLKSNLGERDISFQEIAELVTEENKNTYEEDVEAGDFIEELEELGLLVQVQKRQYVISADMAVLRDHFLAFSAKGKSPAKKAESTVTLESLMSSKWSPEEDFRPKPSAPPQDELAYPEGASPRPRDADIRLEPFTVPGKTGGGRPVASESDSFAAFRRELERHRQEIVSRMVQDAVKEAEEEKKPERPTASEQTQTLAERFAALVRKQREDAAKLGKEPPPQTPAEAAFERQKEEFLMGLCLTPAQKGFLVRVGGAREGDHSMLLQVVDTAEEKYISDREGTLDKLYAKTGRTEEVEDAVEEITNRYGIAVRDGELRIGFDNLGEGVEQLVKLMGAITQIIELAEVAPTGTVSDCLDDPAFVRALRSCVVKRRASITFLRHECKVGYGEACKFLNVMEAMGYVAPVEGSPFWKVLLTRAEFEKRYGPIT